MRVFKQVDVFTATPYRGNALAVVLDGTGLDTATMQRFTDWTNLSEATFLLPPTHPQADYARIDPLPFKAGGAGASMQALAAALRQVAGVRVVSEDAGYLRAEARTRWLGFVDDLEFVADPQRGVIDLRSASRLGAEDFGANRRRIEALRAAYQQLP